jgi:hypothetical protein
MSRLLVAVRVILLLSIAGVLSSKFAAQGTGQDSLRVIQEEHRFTVLETEVNQLVKDIADLKLMDEFKTLGIAALLGESGIRLFGKIRGKA